jgi:hypothetical protein
VRAETYIESKFPSVTFPKRQSPDLGYSDVNSNFQKFPNLLIARGCIAELRSYVHATHLE